MQPRACLFIIPRYDIYVITCGEQYSFPLAFGSRLRGDFRVHIFLEIGLTAKREEEEEEGGRKEG